jgi:CRP-like cAMP-binding protein
MRKQRYLADRILYLTGHDVEERFFLFLGEQFGRRDKYRIRLSKKDIAAAIGTIPETLSRLLLRLREEEKIRWEGENLDLAEGFWERFDGRRD